jgi:hypothetical protein
MVLQNDKWHSIEGVNLKFTGAKTHRVLLEVISNNIA